MRHLKEQYATFQPLQAVCRARLSGEVQGVGLFWLSTHSTNVTYFCGTVPPVGVRGLGFAPCRGQRRRPPLILPQYHQRETADKFKYKFNEKTTTSGHFLPPPLWHGDFTSCLIPLVGYCDTLVGVSCFFGETINPLSSRVVPLPPEASDRERDKNRM